MKIQFVGFGAIEVNGVRFDHDVVIDGGQVRKRNKKPSKQYRSRFGHTPLSAEEDIPWGAGRLVIGTGVYGSMPVTPDVFVQGERRGVGITAVRLEEAIEMLEGIEDSEAFAVLHVTC